MGIVCRRIIKFYVLNGNREHMIPEKNIRLRWKWHTKEAHKGKDSYHDPSKTKDVIRYASMMLTLEAICSKASTYEESQAGLTG